MPYINILDHPFKYEHFSLQVDDDFETLFPGKKMSFLTKWDREMKKMTKLIMKDEDAAEFEGIFLNPSSYQCSSDITIVL